MWCAYLASSWFICFRWYLVSVMMDHYFKLNHVSMTMWVWLILFPMLHQICHASVFYLALVTCLLYSRYSPFFPKPSLPGTSVPLFQVSPRLFGLSETSLHPCLGTLLFPGSQVLSLSWFMPSSFQSTNSTRLLWQWIESRDSES